MRESFEASVVRKAAMPNAWMNEVAQLDCGAPLVDEAQLAKVASLFDEAAQAATASALSSSCEAFSPWTSSELASTENPSTEGSAKTVVMGAAFDVSPKMLWMLLVNSDAVRRQSLRGPGALLVHGLGDASALGNVSVVPLLPPVLPDEPPEPVVLPPPLVFPDPEPVVLPPPLLPDPDVLPEPEPVVLPPPLLLPEPEPVLLPVPDPDVFPPPPPPVVSPPNWPVHPTAIRQTGAARKRDQRSIGPPGGQKKTEVG